MLEIKDWAVLTVAIIAASIAFIQVIRMQKIAHGELLDRVLDRLHSPVEREFRARLYATSMRRHQDWDAQEIEAAAAVGSTFSQVGLLVRHRFLTMDELDYWEKVILRSYRLCRPLIEHRRVSEDNAGLYVHFEWLARTAYKRTWRKPWWQSRRWEKLRLQTADLDLPMGEGEVRPRRFPRLDEGRTATEIRVAPSKADANVVEEVETSSLSDRTPPS